ncbi:MAG: ABC transporter permease [Malacoplasma sp.]|nr:ABC transporter permease [Malacoplasma sp.]
MFKYIVKRLLFAVLALFIVMSLVFLLMACLKVYPIAKTKNETTADYEAKLATMGFLDPIIVRYFNYWKTFFNPVNGQVFGEVFQQQGTPLLTKFFQYAPNTLYIGVISYIVAIIIGFTFGIISAVYRGKWQDTLINVFSVILISVPSFIIGILLLKLAGVLKLPQVFINFDNNNFNIQELITSSIMPILALTFGLASTLTYYVRNELVEVLSQDYIKTAMSKGLKRYQIIIRHGIRNSLIPALSILGPSFLSIITGSIAIETIFGIQGMGNMLYWAILSNQFYIVMFQTFFLSLLYNLIVLALDISFTFIDPRIKIAESSQTSIYNLAKSSALRLAWRNRWKRALLKNEAHLWVNNSDSLFFSLKELNVIDYKKKTVTLNDQLRNSYNIGLEVKYLIIGKNILKIKPEIVTGGV